MTQVDCVFFADGKGAKAVIDHNHILVPTSRNKIASSKLNKLKNGGRIMLF